MINIRCTKKLLDVLPDSVPAPGIATNLLGDWYANIFESNPPVILFMSEKTLLPVVIEAIPIDDMVVNFTEELGNVLAELGLETPVIMRELQHALSFGIGKTANLRTTRLMADPMYHLSHTLYDRRFKSCTQVSLHLASYAWKALGWKKPGEATVELFATQP